jgi:hypothetical protein
MAHADDMFGLLPRQRTLLGGQLQRMMRSENAIIEFEGLRPALAKASDAAEKRELLQKMTGLLEEKRERTMASWETARRDSRLGYEWEQDYIYTPDTISEEIKLLDDTLNGQIAAYRQRQGL